MSRGSIRARPDVGSSRRRSRSLDRLDDALGRRVAAEARSRPGPVLHSRPVRDPTGPSRQTNRPRPAERGTELTRGPFRPGWCRHRAHRGEDRSPATRSAEERTEQEVAHRAVRFDAAAARSRSPLRPPDPPLEPQDAPVHLRGAQRDPHHRPRPDRAAAGRRPRVRPRDRRPRRAGPLRRDQEAGPGADRPGGDPRRHAVRQQALARRHADQLRRPSRSGSGLLEQLEARQAGRRLRADDQEGSRQADRGDDQAPGHARRHAQDEARCPAPSSSSTRTASGSR